MIDFQSAGYTLTEREIQVATREALKSYEEAKRQITAELNGLAAKLEDVPIPDRHNYMLKQNRLKSLLAKVDKQYADLSREAGRKITNAVDIGTNNNYYRQQYVLDWFAPVGGHDVTFMAMPEPLANVITTGNLDSWLKINAAARERIEETFGPIGQYVPEAGSLTDLLANNRQQEIADINRAITTGLIRGQGVREISRNIATVIGSVSKDASSGAMAKALRIARTESIRTMNAGAHANGTRLQKEGITTGRIWLATLDLRTRESHQKLDGKVVEGDGVFQADNGSGPYPGQMGAASENINCRCRVADTINGVPPDIRRGRNPETGRTELMEWKTYPEWKKQNGLVDRPRGVTKPRKKVTTPPRVKKPEIPGDIPPFKSVAEAQRKALELIPGLERANFSGLKKETAWEVVNTLNRATAKYGNLDLKEIVTTTRNNNAQMSAAYWTRRGDGAIVPGKQLIINSRHMGGPTNEVNRRLWRENKSGWSAGSNVSDITTHEIGHFLQYRVAGTRANIHAMRDRSGAPYARGISKYGETNELEAMSEGFVLYDKGEAVPENLMELMSEKMGLDPQ